MGLINLVYVFILLCLSYFTFFHLILWYEIRTKPVPRRSKDSDLPTVSMIMSAYNEESVIEKSLKKLLSIDYPKNKLEVIVIDDGSNDKTYEIAKSFESKNVRVFRKPNTGKASSLNFGINHARHEFVAVMDADSFLNEDALRNCMKYFDGDKVASVTAHVIVKRRKTIWEKLQHTEHMIVAVMRKAQEQMNIISVTPGPLSVYRKKDLVKVGKFDERNLVEDVEIAWRLLKHGYKIKMAFDAMVYSMYPDTLGRWWKQRIRWTIGGLQTFFKYFNSIFDRRSHAIGNFWIPVSVLSYLLIFIGLGIFMYLTSVKVINYMTFILTAFSAGVNPFSRFEFVYSIDLLVIYGTLIFLLSLFVMRLGITVHKDRPRIATVAMFLTVYPILLTFNFLDSIYKFVRMERGWMTK